MSFSYSKYLRILIYYLLILLSISFLLASCGVTDPEASKPPVVKPDTALVVTHMCGEITYESLIGSTWYANENLAACWDGLTYQTSTIEKWRFYADSIVIIATHYDSKTLVARDQFKYIAQLTSIDNVWVDDADGEVWRTTLSYWKQYSRAYAGCDWADIFSFCTGPYYLSIQNLHNTDTIGFGDWDREFYSYLVKTPMRLVYPVGWIGTYCGFVQ